MPYPDQIDYAALPDDLREPLRRYIESGLPTGHFLGAVLQNDLREACARADVFNRARLFEIVSWLYNQAPGSCWGSPERFREWVQRGGLAGPRKPAEPEA